MCACPFSIAGDMYKHILSFHSDQHTWTCGLFAPICTDRWEGQASENPRQESEKRINKAASASQTASPLIKCCFLYS